MFCRCFLLWEKPQDVCEMKSQTGTCCWQRAASSQCACEGQGFKTLLLSLLSLMFTPRHPDSRWHEQTLGYSWLYPSSLRRAMAPAQVISSSAQGMRASRGKDQGAQLDLLQLKTPNPNKSPWTGNTSAPRVTVSVSSRHFCDSTGS